MSFFNAFLISFAAGMSTLLGSLVILFNIKEDKVNKFITFCLSFSIAIMIGISITDLIPTSFFQIFYNYTLFKAIFITIISFILGILIINIINKKMTNNENSLYKLGILNMIALMLHNFPEGIATFIGSISSPSLGIKLSLSIMFHNIPEGISIAVPIYYATKSKRKAIFNTFLSGIAEPFGAVLAYLFLKDFITDTMISIVLLFVAGLMISLSINEMLPKALSYKNNKYIYYGLFLGIILVLINHLLI